MNSQKTPFYQKHIASGARMVDFAGWALPVEYKSMLQEAKAVRRAGGLFDASHMGEILLKGDGAFDFLQKFTTNDISLITAGRMQYNLFINHQGGIIDDFMLYYLSEGLLCVVNSINKDKVLSLLQENKPGNVTVVDRSSKTALLSVQGPAAADVLAYVFSNAAGLKYMHFFTVEKAGGEIIVSRSGYTGEDGFEIYLPWDKACFWWERLTEAGKGKLTLCGLGARDILRIEAGYPLYGHEISDTINPYQACLGWAVKLNKNFIAKEQMLNLKKSGVKNKRVGFIMVDKVPPRQGYPVYSKDMAVGQVCSGTYSPNLEKFIGMAYLEEDYAKIDAHVNIEARGRFFQARITKFPFVEIRTLREEVGNEQLKVYQNT